MQIPAIVFLMVIFWKKKKGQKVHFGQDHFSQIKNFIYIAHI